MIGLHEGSVGGAKITLFLAVPGRRSVFTKSVKLFSEQNIFGSTLPSAY